MKKTFIWIFFLIMGIVIPGISYIIGNLDKKVATNYYNSEITQEIDKNSKITQKIYIPGKIYRLGLRVETYSRINQGRIKVVLEQGKYKDEKIIYAYTLKNREINNIDFNFHGLKEGEATLKVEGIDGEKGNIISLYYSNDTSLGNVIENNAAINKGLVLEMQYYKFDRIVMFQILFLGLTVLCFLKIFKLSKEENKNSNKIYIFTSFMIFFLINVKIPILTFNAQPYYETLNNFMISAVHKNVLDNLFISDVGYWPLFQRIITLFIVKIFGFNLKLSIYLMQNIGIYIITLIGSIFVLKDYKKYGNILFRLCIAVILGGGVTFTSSIEGHYFFNFVYYGIGGIVLISLLNFENLSKRKYLVFLLFTFFICISKAYYVTLIPIGILILTIFYKKIKKREKIFIFTVVLSSFLELLYIKIVSNNGGFALNTSIWQLLKIIFYQSTRYITFLFYPEITSSNIIGLNIIFFLIWSILICFFLYKSIKFKNKNSIISIALIFIISEVILLNTWFYKIDMSSNSNFDWLHKADNMVIRRHSMFIIILLIILIVIFLNNVMAILACKLKRKGISFSGWLFIKNIFYVIMLFIFIIRFSVFDNNEIGETSEDFSIKSAEVMTDWGKYYKFFLNTDTLIPVGDDIFMISGNLNLYFYDNKLQKLDENFVNINRFFIVRITNLDTPLIHEINLEKNCNVKYLYADRIRAFNRQKLKIVGYNEKEEPVLEIQQLNNKDHQFIGFKNNKNEEIRKIRFFTIDNKEAYVKTGVYLGIKE